MAKKKENIEPSNEIETPIVEVKQTDVELHDMKGVVKSVKETYHKAFYKGDKIIRGKQDELMGVETNNITFYNEAGKMTERHHFTKDGGLLKVHYGNNGQYASMVSHKADGSIAHSSTYKFNEKDQCIENCTFQGDGTISSRYEYLYDEKGNTLGHNTYYGKEELLTSKNRIIYDDKGFKIEGIDEDGKGNIMRRTTFKNNHKGNCVELATYTADGSLDQRIMCYDDYDANGDRKVKEKVAKRSEDFEENAWERDAFGNWIEKWKYYKSEITNVWVRELVYYGEQPPFKEYLSIVEDAETSSTSMNIDNESDGKVPSNKLSIQDLDPQLARWLQEASPTPDIFSAPRIMFLKIINRHP